MKTRPPGRKKAIVFLVQTINLFAKAKERTKKMRCSPPSQSAMTKFVNSVAWKSNLLSKPGKRSLASRLSVRFKSDAAESGWATINSVEKWWIVVLRGVPHGFSLITAKHSATESVRT